MKDNFEMVAKTMKGLEEVLAEELRNLGADNVQPGCRMVSFEGDKEMLYRANLACRTALRILKPFYKFTADNTDDLYEAVKSYDWGSILTPDKTFCIDTVVNSDEFTHSHFVTYRVKDAIVDWFKDRYDSNTRPDVRLKNADVMINVHISGSNITLSLDSSGESLHKRGYRVAQTEAPINEVLAAGIILLSGWRGESTFVDPMCGSGTFLIEAALIAANINPGIYRKSFAFEAWPDFDQDLFDSLYNDDSAECEVNCRILGADISPKAIEVATANIKSAGVAKYIELQTKPLSQWTEAPQPAGVLVTNPPYGERISAPDMDALYSAIGNRLKNIFLGYHAWIIGYRQDYFHCIGLAPSQKIQLLNGSLECELREYIIFEGDKKSFLASGGKIKHYNDDDDDDRQYHGGGRGPRKFRDNDSPRRDRKGYGDADHRADDRSRRRDDDRRSRRDDRRGRDDDRRNRRFDDNHLEPESDNPLAKRRNPRLFENFTVMKPRIGVPRDDSDTETHQDRKPKRSQHSDKGDRPNHRKENSDRPKSKDGAQGSRGWRKKK